MTQIVQVAPKSVGAQARAKSESDGLTDYCAPKFVHVKEEVGTGCDDLFSRLQPESLLPPLIPWHGSSESLLVGDDHPWITPAEKGGLAESPGFAEAVDWLEKLCAACPLISMQSFGLSAQGRALLLVIASSESSHTPSSLRNSGKPSLLVQAGIHAGEIEGKDAGFMLLRDIAFGELGGLLNGANLLFIPVLNPDGHERTSMWNRPNQRGPRNMGWRTTAQNVNLNRDYVKADSPEMRALLSILNDWPLDFYIDIHATDGLDFQYDITYAYHGREGSPSWSPAINRWIDQYYSPAIDTALRRNGHLPLNFYVSPLFKDDLAQGLREWQMPPRFSLGYGDLRHIPTVLVETHSLKPYRQRVLATYVMLEASLRLIAKEKSQLASAISEDLHRRSREVTLGWISGGPQRSLDFLGIERERFFSPASGAFETRWVGRKQTYAKLPVFTDKVGRVARRPAAYWVPETKNHVIELLNVHGVQFETLSHATTLGLESYRLILSSKSQNVKLEESRHVVGLGSVEPEYRRFTFHPGSVRIPTNQALGDLVIMLLEPMGADSLFRWGFFSEVLQQTEYIEGYLIAPLAELMLEGSPELKAEFEATLERDSTFASSPTARLRWFYERTPFFDQAYLRYPIGIER